jgi:hypothetical protein
MPEDFDTRQCLGPLVNQIYTSQLCELDERVWEVFRAHARDHGAIEDGGNDFLIVRMMHIADATSNGIRLNATWGLIPPAMSLVRDRYEQTIRFSWLVRNPDQKEFQKYERFMIAKIRNIVRNIAPESIKRFTEAGQVVPLWATEELGKGDRAYLEEWENLDLCSMAAKRDKFPPIANNRVAKEKLEPWYNAVYRQLSSMSHYDRFAVEMVRPLPAQDGTVMLGLQSHWPKLLILYTVLLDIIQCYEATAVCLAKDTSVRFESLFLEWAALAERYD